MSTPKPKLPSLRVTGAPTSSWQDTLELMLQRGTAGVFLLAGPTSGDRAALFDTVVLCLDEIRRDGLESGPVWDLGGVLADRALSVDWIRQLRPADVTLGPDVVSLLTRHGVGGVLLGDLSDRESAEIAIRAATSGLAVFAGIEARSPETAVSALEALGVSPLSMTVHVEAVLY